VLRLEIERKLHWWKAGIDVIAELIEDLKLMEVWYDYDPIEDSHRGGDHDNQP
jgi:hypothetical protein